MVFLADAGLGFLTAGLAATLVATLAAGLAVGLAFTAGRGGAFLATGFALVMASSTATTLDALTHRAALTSAHQSAQAAYVLAQGVHQQGIQQSQWLQAQLVSQQQTLQWAQVLNQLDPGVWVMRVEQQDRRWRMQGEALSSAHATQVLQQLKALAIWRKAPELSQLQVKSPAITNGLPIWQFRIEAELKGEG